MKRIYALALAMLLLLTGCAGKVKADDISVKDGRCPYKINHKKDVVEITLRDGEKSGILWEVETTPEDVCVVTEEKAGKEYTSCYRISGTKSGAAQVTFSGREGDGSLSFVLTTIVEVDSAGKAFVTSNSPKDVGVILVDENGLNYKWNVDTDGFLNFSFIDRSDSWSISGDGGDVCTLYDMMSTPSGCKFSAQAKSEGHVSLLVVGQNTQREIGVTIQVDNAGDMKVISVQEL